MLVFALMAMADGQTNEEPLPITPTVRQLRLSSQAGACNGAVVSQSAAVILRWLSAAGDEPGHEIRIYKNGTLRATLASTAVSYTDTLTEVVEGGTRNSFTTDWTYMVKLVRIADEVVVEKLTAPWNKQYGSCSGTNGSSPRSGLRFT